MTKNLFFFDLTRHRGSAQSLIRSARAYAQSSQATAVEWFISSFQRVDGASLEGTIHQVSDRDVWALLETRLLEVTRNGVAGDTICIFSHSGYVLSKAEALSSLSATIRAASFKSLPRSTPVNSFHSNAAGKMSVDEAVELTKRILTEGGHVSEDHALLESHLRPKLSKLDVRALKRPGDPTSLSLIAEVIDNGMNNGWLKRGRKSGQFGAERIWLAQQNLQIKAVAVSASSPSTPVQTILPAPDTPETGIAVSSQSSPMSKGKAKTQEIIGTLNKAFVYSPCNIRRYAFAAINSIKKEGIGHKTVGQFMKEVKQRASTAAANDQVCYKHWGPTMNAIQEMLLAAKTLIGPGEKAITRGLHARGTQVVSIAENFEDLSELFLLKILIQKMQLTSKDRVSIAHALFKEGFSKQFDALEERLDTLFTMLGNELAESAEGIIILDEISTTSTAPRVN